MSTIFRICCEGSLQYPPFFYVVIHLSSPFRYSCKIQLHLLETSKTPPNECPGYDIEQSNGQVPVMLKLWGM